MIAVAAVAAALDDDGYAHLFAADVLCDFESVVCVATQWESWAGWESVE